MLTYLIPVLFMLFAVGVLVAMFVAECQHRRKAKLRRECNELLREYGYRSMPEAQKCISMLVTHDYRGVIRVLREGR